MNAREHAEAEAARRRELDKHQPEHKIVSTYGASRH